MEELETEGTFHVFLAHIQRALSREASKGAKLKYSVVHSAENGGYREGKFFCGRTLEDTSYRAPIILQGNVVRLPSGCHVRVRVSLWMIISVPDAPRKVLLERSRLFGNLVVCLPI
mmetsp:Transcript_3363/g.5332  ORF Transcript_3363/g.5332 Transcript_3363/m.5332 type:complete len:116 (+) Transcript_3363:158-505(+)